MARAGTGDTAGDPEVVLYLDAERKWRWLLVGRTGHQLAESCRGYANRAGAIGSWKRAWRAAQSLPAFRVAS